MLLVDLAARYVFQPIALETLGVFNASAHQFLNSLGIIFFPVAIETAGAWNHLAIELVQEIGRRTTAVTEEPRESTFLFQRLSIALQRGNAVAFRGTFNTE